MILEISNLSLKFNQNYIIQNLNLSLNKGEILYILGPNGSGKSSLVNLINRLLLPSSGFIKNNSKLTSTMFQNQVKKHNFPITVYELLDTSIDYKKYKIIERKERINYFLNLLEINDLKNRLINNLSGGEMQRVIFIKTIINEPDLLILDEPTSNIDPIFRKKFLNIIENLNKTLNTTIIMITHDLTDLNLHCKNKVLYLDRKAIFYDNYCAWHQKYGEYHEHK